MARLKIVKPLYSIPSMKEISQVKLNGYNVISTFSGCGGSSLGYTLAGFKVLWASEFIPIAQEIYRLNHPNTILNTKDIREVTPEEILKESGIIKGQLDLLDGSPPCASFSHNPKIKEKQRHHTWNSIRKYSDTKQRIDDLFFEYARIIKGIQPRVFVGENVPALSQGVSIGYFKTIFKALKDCGYNVKARILDASWLDVPQGRRRLFFIGVRNDLNLEPSFPKPLSYQRFLNEVITSKTKYDSKRENWNELSLCKLDKSQWKKTNIGDYPRINWGKPRLDKPCRTILADGNLWHPFEMRYLSIKELKMICAFPHDFKLIGSYKKQRERLGRAVPPLMMYQIAKTIKEEILDTCLKKMK